MATYRWQPARVAPAVFATVVFAAAVEAQPAPNRCQHQEIAAGLARVAQGTLKPVPLFDETKSLRAAPNRPISLPAAVAVEPACVALVARFTETNGSLYLETSNLVAAVGVGTMLPGRRGRAVGALLDAANQVVRELAQQQLFPERPRPGTNYLIVLPMWRGHPIYQAPGAEAVAAAAPSSSSAPTLRDRGYQDASFVGRFGEIELFRILDRGARVWFAVVRPIGKDEPILRYAGDVDARLRMTALGTAEVRRFDEVVVPNLRETGALTMSVEVRHYAKDVHIPYQPDSRFEHNEQGRHPLTGLIVEVPIGIERWTGQRSVATGPFRWTTLGAFGTRRAELNTIAAIMAVQDSIGARQAGYAQLRATRDAKERDLVLAGRARVAERERRKPALYAAKRLSYKEASYWNQFQLGGELRMIFDGYYPDALRDWRFGRIYFRAVTTYGDECRADLPPGTPLRIDSTFRQNYFDNEPRFVRSDTIFIHPGYFRVFKGWFERSLDVPATIPAEATPSAVLRDVGKGIRGMVDVGLVKTAVKSDMELLHREGCRSGALLQFMENLRRLGDRLPTLQAELVPETFPSPDDPPSTIGEACQKYDRDNGVRPNVRWCDCLDRVLTPRYRPADLERLMEQYSAFIERVSFPPGGDTRRTPAPEYAAANACRQ